MVQEIRTDKLVQTVSSCSIPLLIVWGDSDHKSMPVCSEINENGCSSSITQTTIRNADHLFSSKKFENELFFATLNFIRRNH